MYTRTHDARPTKLSPAATAAARAPRRSDHSGRPLHLEDGGAEPGEELLGDGLDAAEHDVERVEQPAHGEDADDALAARGEGREDANLGVERREESEVGPASRPFSHQLEGANPLSGSFGGAARVTESQERRGGRSALVSCAAPREGTFTMLFDPAARISAPHVASPQ